MTQRRRKFKENNTKKEKTKVKYIENEDMNILDMHIKLYIIPLHGWIQILTRNAMYDKRITTFYI